ncbi:Sap, sulfolipid-1-addressing protein [Nocardioides alpinus]|uniref:Sap, sulfolipid-1-addressing protein n=1 Tax=Nocardioides alpinus TaxID=748909 RepID=A0A1I1AVX0_9ACTN|nr:GAP family protein [Nocardioides alpinus]PKH40936.1 hypothetical protein CXG46_10780 [Nocardioides alpinus]SFB42181.1 Sap, sulfolipid-1-addressing protein [Nocardioides alpinus]
MTSLWTTLAPLAIGSAVVPIQVVVTLLLLRGTGGPSVAAAWVAGMTSVRLTQGVVFGLVLTGSSTGQGADDAPGPVVSGILLVLAVLLYALALRQLTADDDPDAPPPRWMAMTDGMGPGRAFAMGAGVLAIGPKFWVFTLAAVGAISDADLGQAAGITTFLLFVVLAASLNLVLLGAALVAPARSARLMDRASDWLVAHNGQITVALGLVVGTWFLVKALTGLGIL